MTAGGEDQRRRLEFIAECERSIRKCMRRQMIGNYIPGHAAYNLAKQ